MGPLNFRLLTDDGLILIERDDDNSEIVPMKHNISHNSQWYRSIEYGQFNK